MTALVDILATGSLRSVFQPIVQLDSGRVVAYEALARGPAGPLHTPDALFAAAREQDRLTELDEACRRAAFRGAVEQRLLAPLTVFVNVEPEVLDGAPLQDLLAIADGAPGELRVVMEITEGALATRPAELLRTVERVREFGWAIALDDVGAQPASLAFMALLHPDVVKLDLRLVQGRPGPAVAEIMNAVNAYAESSGALVLAEGVETEQQLQFARALGASLGQGWLFGRPGPGAAADLAVGELTLPVALAGTSGKLISPFNCLPATVMLRQAPKALLIELSKHLEREAMRLGETCVLAAAFQQARHFTPSTAQRYRDLVARTGFVCALGADMPAEPLPGLRGATLSSDDPVLGEWDVVVLSPHFSAALLARDLGDPGPERTRRFEYALTYQRETVVRAAHGLLSRVLPRLPAVTLPSATQPSASQPSATQPSATHPMAAPARVAARAGSQALMPAAADAVLGRALAMTASGVTVADMLAPDQPLIYVNASFEALAGFPADQLLGRNCRFPQGPDTDRAALSRIRAAITAGLPHQETLLNYRGPQLLPWWNEVHLMPVLDATGLVVQYIGVQHDVSSRVHAERALRREQDQSRDYLAQLEQLGDTDVLTGLPTRRQIQEQTEAALWNVRASDGALALMRLDLAGLGGIGDRQGYAAADELLARTATCLRERLRRGDLLARLGGNEFLVVLPGLAAPTARPQAEQVADQLRQAVAALQHQQVRISAAIGISICPDDGADFGRLLQVAGTRLHKLAPQRP